MARSTFLPDDALTLSDGATAITADGLAQDGGADAILDFGESTRQGTIQYVVSALDFTTTDETYTLEWQGDDTNSDLSSPTTIATQTVPSSAATDGVFNFPVRNELGSTQYRYCGLNVNVGGTTPSITFTAHFTGAHPPIAG